MITNFIMLQRNYYPSFMANSKYTFIIQRPAVLMVTAESYMDWLTPPSRWPGGAVLTVTADLNTDPLTPMSS